MIDPMLLTLLIELLVVTSVAAIVLFLLAVYAKKRIARRYWHWLPS